MTHRSRSFPFVLGLIAAVCSAQSPDAAVTPAVSAASGQGADVLSIPANPHPAERFAASELQRYIARMTGIVLPIEFDVDSTKAAVVHVGAALAAVEAGIVPAPRYPEDDQYRIVARGDDLYIAGCSPRGTLFAAYDLLQRLGCRWFAPGYRFYKGMHESVPTTAILDIERILDVTEVPAFKFRQEFIEHYYLHEPDDVVALIDWCAKSRINTVTVRLNELSSVWYRVLEPECTKRGLMLTAEAHAFDRFLPRSEYFHEHPEWYGHVNGESSDRYFDQFRLTNPEAVETFSRNLHQFVANFPALYSISAMPNDSPRWTDEDLAVHTPVDLLFMSYAIIAKTVYEANPSMKVSIGVGVEYFGQDGTQIWESPYPNVTWHTAVLRRTLKQPWNDPASKQNWPQYETAAAVTKTLVARGENVVWSSRYAPFRDLCLPGLLYADQMAIELRDLKAIGGAGIDFNYAVPPAWIPYELKHYLFARLAWDPDLEPAPLLDAYYRDRFPGAPEEMKSYYAALHRAMERYAYPGGGYSREEAYGRYPDDAFEEGFRDLDEARESIDRALQVNPNDKEKQIIWLLRVSLEYGRRKMEIDELDQTGHRESAAIKVTDLMDWLESWTTRGVVYDSSFLRMGLERRFLGPPREIPIKQIPPDNLRVYEYKDYVNSGDATNKTGDKQEPEEVANP